MRVPRPACLLLAVACGDIQTAARGDGGATSDAGAPDARAVGSVTVTVGRLFGDEQPIQGNQVLLVDTSGAVVADTLTDAGGVASADGVEAGSTLIVLIAAPPSGAPAGSQALIVTGVEPGDDIHIDAESDEGARRGMMNVFWGPMDGAFNYEVSNGCETTTTNDQVATMTFYEACTPDGQASALIRALDDAGFTLGWLGGSTTFAEGDPLDLGGAWTAPRDLAVTLTDIPSEAQRVSIGLRPAKAGVGYNRVNLPVFDLSDDSLQIQLATPRAFADSDLVTLSFQPNQPSFGENSLAVRIPPDQTELDVAVAEELVPWYSFPLFDGETRTFSWARSSGREADAQFVAMFWSDKVGTAGATFVMVPPDVTSVTLPELPAEVERFLPDNASSVGVQVQAGESSDIDGYRAARQTGFSLIYNTPPLGLEPPSTLRRASGGDDF